jgi:hypothetical protein
MKELIVPKPMRGLLLILVLYPMITPIAHLDLVRQSLEINSNSEYFGDFEIRLRQVI